MKDLRALSKEEFQSQMFDWFPWLKNQAPYQAPLRSKEQREYDHGWAMWRADMKETMQYFADLKPDNKI